MTLSDLESLIRDTEDPRALFGPDIDAKLKDFRVLCHPDHHPADAERAQAIFVRLAALAEEARKPRVEVHSPTRCYSLVRQIAMGDIADVHLAEAEGKRYVLKLSRIPGGDVMLAGERKTVGELLTAAGDLHYRKNFPTIAESWPVRDRIPRRVNAFVYQPGFYTAEEVLAKHRGGLDGRHIAWFFKRLLTAVGFAHRAGFVHGAVVPPHVLIDPANHSVQLVGWSHAVRIGSKIRTVPAKYKTWYPREVREGEDVGPATDIYFAAKMSLYLAGADPVAMSWPETIPKRMWGFLRSCLMDSASMRPADGFELHSEFDGLLRELYGPPKFHPLVMG